MPLEENKPQQVNLFTQEVEEGNPLLRDKFMEPPFSVLNTMGGDWQKRKKYWSALGMQSELGRDARAIQSEAFDPEKYGRKIMTGQSIFDPALTELLYFWYCPENGSIIDPFAGGSVRGIVAEYLGYKYTGIELRPEQVKANREQARQILDADKQPKYFCGDSDKVLNVPNFFKPESYDLVFSCPPYHDIEVYSDLPDDLSNMTYPNFLVKYRSIIAASVKLLKKGGYAIFVVAEVRNKKTGQLIGFVPDTISAFVDAGTVFYNEAILLNAYGTAMLRVGTNFIRGDKKLVKVHQNILIFKKV